ncbi:hypothetical protein CSPX01_10257 [Colletotrichum filicis]|nr:hypothetical protein CSPX01_10257 [Colletotrichum filicis]
MSTAVSSSSHIDGTSSSSSHAEGKLFLQPVRRQLTSFCRSNGQKPSHPRVVEAAAYYKQQVAQPTQEMEFGRWSPRARRAPVNVENTGALSPYRAAPLKTYDSWLNYESPAHCRSDSIFYSFYQATDDRLNNEVDSAAANVYINHEEDKSRVLGGYSLELSVTVISPLTRKTHSSSSLWAHYEEILTNIRECLDADYGSPIPPTTPPPTTPPPTTPPPTTPPPTTPPPTTPPPTTPPPTTPPPTTPPPTTPPPTMPLPPPLRAPTPLPQEFSPHDRRSPENPRRSTSIEEQVAVVTRVTNISGGAGDFIHQSVKEFLFGRQDKSMPSGIEHYKNLVLLKLELTIPRTLRLEYRLDGPGVRQTYPRFAS